jgi:hypothetical protein
VQYDNNARATTALTMTETRDAMGALGRPFDVVFFESCLMVSDL